MFFEIIGDKTHATVKAVALCLFSLCAVFSHPSGTVVPLVLLTGVCFGLLPGVRARWSGVEKKTDLLRVIVPSLVVLLLSLPFHVQKIGGGGGYSPGTRIAQSFHFMTWDMLGRFFYGASWYRGIIGVVLVVVGLAVFLLGRGN